MEEENDKIFKGGLLSKTNFSHILAFIYNEFFHLRKSCFILNLDFVFDKPRNFKISDVIIDISAHQKLHFRLFL